MNNKRCSAGIVRKIVVDLSFVENLVVTPLVNVVVGSVVDTKKKREKDAIFLYVSIRNLTCSTGCNSSSSRGCSSSRRGSDSSGRSNNGSGTPSCCQDSGSCGSSITPCVIPFDNG